MKLIKGCNDKATIVCVGNAKTLFSYETEIATYNLGEFTFVNPDETYSATTKKHIKWFKNICETED